MMTGAPIAPSSCNARDLEARDTEPPRVSQEDEHPSLDLGARLLGNLSGLTTWCEGVQLRMWLVRSVHVAWSRIQHRMRMEHGWLMRRRRRIQNWVMVKP